MPAFLGGDGPAVRMARTTARRPEAGTRRRSAPPSVFVVGSPRIVREMLAAALAQHGLTAAAPPDAADFAPGPDSIGVLVAESPSDVRAAAGFAAAGRPVVALVDPGDVACRTECAAIGVDLLVPSSTPLSDFADLLRAVGRGERPASPIDPAAADDRFAANLTRREREILSDLMAGRRAAAIARHSFVSLNTVRSQIRSLLRKLDVHSQLEAVALARRAGWRGDR